MELKGVAGGIDGFRTIGGAAGPFDGTDFAQVVAFELADMFLQFALGLLLGQFLLGSRLTAHAAAAVFGTRAVGIAVTFAHAGAHAATAAIGKGGTGAKENSEDGDDDARFFHGVFSSVLVGMM